MAKASDINYRQLSKPIGHKLKPWVSCYNFNIHSHQQ